MDYDNLADKSFDSDFKEIITHHGLTWIPWVGKRFKDDDQKILIVAESHYSNEYDNAKRLKMVEYTRAVMYESAANKQWQNKMIENVHRALLKTNSFDGAKLWENLAFYNFIQRPMQSSKARPTPEDFKAGWKAFSKVIHILQPKLCIFVGVGAANYFNLSMTALKIPHEKVSFHGSIKRVKARQCSVTTDGAERKIIYIRHTSQFFPYWEWNNYLEKTIPDSINHLTRLVF